MSISNKFIVIINSKGYFLKHPHFAYKSNPFTNKFSYAKKFNTLEDAQFCLEINIKEPNCKVVYFNLNGQIEEVQQKIENPYKLVK
jgi:hypothetical protein